MTTQSLPAMSRIFCILSFSLLFATLTACTRSRPVSYPASVESLPLHRRNQAQLFNTEDGPLWIDASDPQLGSPQARCTVVVFSDFLCPFCQDAAHILTRLRHEFRDQIRIVFKFLPLGMHSNAFSTAIAAYVVFLEAGPSTFWKFHDRLFSDPHAISDIALIHWLQDIGIPYEKLQRRQAEAKRHIQEDVAQAERLSIEGTPQLYINQRSVRGVFPYETIKKWVQATLEE